MTLAEFYVREGKIISFRVKGHSGYSEAGKDIVCASVSSTVWMTINGIDNVLGIKCEYYQRDDEICCSIFEKDIDDAQALLQSLKQFLENLSVDYEKYLTVKEVQNNV